MPAATLQRLNQLAADGATVVFEKLPEDVNGFGRLEARRAEFKAALAKVAPAAVPADLFATLASRNIQREAIAETGVDRKSVV